MMDKKARFAQEECLMNIAKRMQNLMKLTSDQRKGDVGRSSTKLFTSLNHVRVQETFQTEKNCYQYSIADSVRINSQRYLRHGCNQSVLK